MGRQGRSGTETVAECDRCCGSPKPVTGPTVGSKKAGFALGVAAALILAVTAAYLGYNRIVTRQAAADARGSPPQRSVAVLPFLDLTTQEMNEEYFADGITEELIGDLSRVPGLRVPGPSSSFYFKGKDVPLAVVARQLGVYFVVDGSVRKAGTSYRVATRLSRADNGYVIWTNAYERQLGDLLTIQKSIAAEAAVAIRESIERALAATAIFTAPRTGFREAAVVRPAKAGAFCGSQSHRGKSRSLVAWVAGSVGKP
jgi:TolB-like protein